MSTAPEAFAQADRNNRNGQLATAAGRTDAAGPRPKSAIRTNAIERTGAGLDPPFRAGTARAARYDQHLVSATTSNSYDGKVFEPAIPAPFGNINGRRSAEDWKG